jgi:hypothetical protein
MPDYPDWTRLFYLTGTAITIPINIEASEVALDVKITGSTAILTVTVQAVLSMVNVQILSSVVTLDVNIESQTANIDFNFADQSVAVFDAAKWFAHQATQVFLTGIYGVADNTCQTIIDYTVPAGKNLYIVGASYATAVGGDPPKSTKLELAVASTIVLYLGDIVGAGIPLDTPIRATAGQQVLVALCQYASGGTKYMYGGIWGYLEDA